jgi:hypothetical protein
MSTSQGCLAEAIFITECIKRKIEILQPVVDIHGYDFVIKSKKYHSIQVKSTSKPDMRYPNKPSYKVNVRKGAYSRAYEKGDFDFIAAYLIDIDQWYIFPLDKINSTTVRINPNSPKCKFSIYKDAWNLLL